jgi:hypothetical protein
MEDDNSEIFAESDDDTILESDITIGGGGGRSGGSLRNQPSNSGD